MGSSKTCYVSMPFGRKEVDGFIVDFDRVYETLMRPGLERLDVIAHRADEVTSTGIVMKAVTDAILRCDFMIADVTGSNGNVLYELGIRHGLRPTGTVIVQGDGLLPFDLRHLWVLRYASDPSTDDAERFWTQLERGLEADTRSPIYELHPDLRVDMGWEQSPVRVRVKDLIRRIEEATRVPSMQERLEILGRVEDELGDIESEDSREPAWQLMRVYRDSSHWRDVVRVYDRFSAALEGSREARQQLALALTRRGESGDRDRALDVLQQLIINDGGSDPETFSLLAVLHKRHYGETGELRDLAEAIRAFRQSYELHVDLYSGLNLVALLDEQASVIDSEEDRSSAEGERDMRITELESEFGERVRRGPEDFWSAASLLELACLARDWDLAGKRAKRLRGHKANEWMLETVGRQLHKLCERFHGEDRAALTEVISELDAASMGERRS